MVKIKELVIVECGVFAVQAKQCVRIFCKYHSLIGANYLMRENSRVVGPTSCY